MLQANNMSAEEARRVTFYRLNCKCRKLLAKFWNELKKCHKFKTNCTALNTNLKEKITDIPAEGVSIE